jgi:hypothetical protein
LTNGLQPPSGEARTYAVRELARRAGAGAALRGWKIQHPETQTQVWPVPGSEKCIVFPRASERFWEDALSGNAVTARANWMAPPSGAVAAIAPDLIVPFCSNFEATDSKPLFFLSSPDVLECSSDLVVSALLTLSRFEELGPQGRDEHGRFPATASIAFKESFLWRPIVDEYGLALEQGLSSLFPSWQPAARELSVKLSHDIDVVGIPFYWRSTLEHSTRRRSVGSTLRDLTALATPVEPTFLHLVRRIAGMSLQRGLDSAVYWKSSPNSNSGYDSRYDPRDPKIRDVMRWLRDQGVEQGFHPGYLTFENVEQLQGELRILREALGDGAIGGRQHYLRWTPQTWEHWERCGLAYDSTLGFADQLGFRAGTCHPYRPWLLRENRQARLLEIPLIVMDGTLVDYMKLMPAQSVEAVGEMVNRCRLVGGVFALLWHNSTLLYPAYGDTYDRVLEMVSGCRRFDWQKRLAEEV